MASGNTLSMRRKSNASPAKAQDSSIILKYGREKEKIAKVPYNFANLRTIPASPPPMSPPKTTLPFSEKPAHSAYRRTAADTMGEQRFVKTGNLILEARKYSHGQKEKDSISQIEATTNRMLVYDNREQFLLAKDQELKTSIMAIEKKFDEERMFMRGSDSIMDPRTRNFNEQRDRLQSTAISAIKTLTPFRNLKEEKERQEREREEHLAKYGNDLRKDTRQGMMSRVKATGSTLAEKDQRAHSQGSQPLSGRISMTPSSLPDQLDQKMMQKQPNPLSYVLTNQYVTQHRDTALVTRTEQTIISEFATNFLKQEGSDENGKDDHWSRDKLSTQMNQLKMPIIPKNDYNSGPQLVDVRLLKRDTYESENAYNGRIFWKKHMSDDPEIRWDVFEENILLYLETQMQINYLILKRINWSKFLAFLKDKLSQTITDRTVTKEIPTSPIYKDPPIYQGPVVTLDNWIKFVEEY